jgi:1,4-alpha-glucan branching enzyme
MKKYLLSFVIVFFSFQGFSQLLSWSPQFPMENSTPVTVTVDANYGNKGLLNYTPSDVYVHIGVITNLSTNSGDWRYVKTTWGTTDAAAKATSLGNNKWSFTIVGGLRSYFGITNPGETIQKIAILFRSGSGDQKQANADGTDMFVPVYTNALAIRINTPFFQAKYNPVPEPITKNINDVIPIIAVSSANAALSISFNGSVIQTAANAQTISASPTIVAPGNQQIIVKADNGSTAAYDTLNFFVNGSVNVAPLPAGAQTGINYGSDNKSVTLVLYAPGKSRVCVIGEFTGSNWQEQSQFEMNKTPDGNSWWITINNLTSGKEYAYQFLVDGILKIADPYTEKILDPVNDQYISSTTYPGLKAYPTGLTTGIVSLLQTAQTAYNWQVNNFAKPDKKSLVIYELLLRDFIANHDWKTLSDSISYFKKLGINAIEVMPFNEFEGNISWGYNPSFYFAPDKYYGPENTLKAFIDKCHQNGIAVIMDIVLNHSFGSSPMVQLYWNSATNTPARNNPWYDSVTTHPFNVGYQFNHDAPATRYFVSRVVNHWLNDYKIDGFRFDLSKGFTQTVATDVTTWGHYDADRVAIWKQYYDTLQLKSPNSYCILEHFADNDEETVLSSYGMMLWGNENYNYNQATMGYSDGWNFNYGLASARGWANPFLVTYAESHDEERLMYKNIQFGNSAGSYKIQDTATALKREELAAAFLLTQPGPKMIWQFEELGYDYSINTCGDLTVNNNCRTDPKPIRWDYLQQTNRKELHDVYSALIKLRFNSSYADEFISNTSQQDFSGSFKWLTLNKIVVVGNFDVTTQSGTVTFPGTGTWYDYLNGTTRVVSNVSQSFTLNAGEYHVFTRTAVALPVTIVNFSGKEENNANLLSWQVGNEINLNYYELERSNDGQNFSFVANIKANGQQFYSYVDANANSFFPQQYYRLKSVDMDGNFNYSGIIKIKTKNLSLWSAKVSPNPISEKIYLKIESPVEDKATVIITDLSGRRLYKEKIFISEGNNSFEMNKAVNFSNGTYFISIFSPQQTKTIKVIKNK